MGQTGVAVPEGNSRVKTAVSLIKRDNFWISSKI
jgi:hypothetical protein